VRSNFLRMVDTRNSTTRRNTQTKVKFTSKSNDFAKRTPDRNEELQFGPMSKIQQGILAVAGDMATWGGELRRISI